MRRKIMAAAAAMVMLGLGVLLGFTSSASAGSTPTPTPTQPVNPVVNPFAGCNFSTTQAFTFDPARGRFVIRLLPAIVCDGPGRLARVFILATAPGQGLGR